MALDLSSLGRAIDQLARGLERSQANPGDELLRDGVIQRFEYTYELSHKMLRRFFEETEASADPDRLSFPNLIRLAAERGVIDSGWDIWSRYRAARGTTSHAYDAAKAAEVFALVPGFLADARALLAALERRLMAP